MLGQEGRTGRRIGTSQSAIVGTASRTCIRAPSSMERCITSGRRDGGSSGGLLSSVRVVHIRDCSRTCTIIERPLSTCATRPAGTERPDKRDWVALVRADRRGACALVARVSDGLEVRRGQALVSSSNCKSSWATSSISL